MSTAGHDTPYSWDRGSKLSPQIAPRGTASDPSLCHHLAMGVGDGTSTMTIAVLAEFGCHCANTTQVPRVNTMGTHTTPEISASSKCRPRARCTQTQTQIQPRTSSSLPAAQTTLDALLPPPKGALLSPPPSQRRASPAAAAGKARRAHQTAPYPSLARVPGTRPRTPTKPPRGFSCGRAGARRRVPSPGGMARRGAREGPPPSVLAGPRRRVLTPPSCPCAGASYRSPSPWSEVGGPGPDALG